MTRASSAVRPLRYSRLAWKIRSGDSPAGWDERCGDGRRNGRPMTTRATSAAPAAIASGHRPVNVATTAIGSARASTYGVRACSPTTSLLPDHPSAWVASSMPIAAIAPQARTPTTITPGVWHVVTCGRRT